MRELELQSAVSKVKWRVLPLFVVMFIVNYIDRVNISFIKEQLGNELGIGDLAYGFGAGLFFWGYALLEVPANLALERLGARRWLTIIAVTWGLLATGLAFVRNEYEFYALRFALGAAEAGFFPGVVYYFTRWLPSAERGKAMAIFLSGSAIATILSGPLSSYLLQLNVPGLQPWQWMIVFEGAFSVVMAGVLWLLLDSHISDARWLTPGERTSLEQTLEAERARAARPGPVDKLALLTSPVVLGYCGVYFAIQLTIYAVTFWLPTIIKEMLATPGPHGGLRCRAQHGEAPSAQHHVRAVRRRLPPVREQHGTQHRPQREVDRAPRTTVANLADDIGEGGRVRRTDDRVGHLGDVRNERPANLSPQGRLGAHRPSSIRSNSSSVGNSSSSVSHASISAAEGW